MKHSITRNFFTSLLLPALFVSCTNQNFHIYSDPAYKQQVENKFAERKMLAAQRDSALFGVFNQPLSHTEQEGLKFLFAYMPLNDLADYSGDFFLKQVRWSLDARENLPWGKSIPEDVFRHFVLPYRVNNENLDTARIVFYHELKDRIKNLPMLDAALEVNHWCHEKVTYKGSDGRTSAPLASVKTAYGRCGEESTFTVTALRSVAIPARQVYTPRWAHSDDNHAWVEFWADGKWHYMGACEPECIPDLGWFTEPARRAMLIHTKAFGSYQGDERVENRETNYALLNTLATYAPTKTIQVKALNNAQQPVKNATIEFQLYNYAEFYPISVKHTNTNGLCDFVTGFGDLLVWAYSDSLFGFKKITVADTDTLTLILNQKPYNALNLDLDLVPPIQREPLNKTNDCADANAKKLSREDSIRSAYEKTFMTEDQSNTLASSLHLDPAKIWNFISRSRGNYREIESFLKSTDHANQLAALELLNLISDKDLRDSKASILLDHLQSAIPMDPEFKPMNPEINPYILNPRVANEMLVAYRKYLTSHFGPAFIDRARKNPESFVEWIKKEIQMVPNENYYNTPLTPIGVYDLRVADEDSRKIFTVACFRTFGIPSRLRSGTLEVEYEFNNQWKTINFNETADQPQADATLTLKSDPANPVKIQYETHYTIARYDKGKYKTLAYGDEHFGDPLAAPLILPQGNYLLVTGNRLPGGSVLCNLSFFQLKPGEKKNLSVTLRQSAQKPATFGVINPVWPVNPIDNKPFDWAQIQGTDKAVICWIDPDKEPTKHVFQDLGTLKNEIDKLNCPFIFLIPKNKMPAGFSVNTWKNLPALSRFATIPDLSSLAELEKASGKSLANQLPVVIRTNKAGDVKYLSSGYKIGVGEELIKELNRK